MFTKDAAGLDRMAAMVTEACWLVTLVALPLLVNPSGQYVFSFAKASWLHVAVAVMVAAMLLRAGVAIGQTSGRLSWSRVAAAVARFLRSPLTLPVVALAGVYVLSTVLSIAPGTSLWGTASRMQGTYTTLAMIGFFLVLAHQVRTPSQVGRLVWAVIIGGSLVAVAGLAEWFGWSPWLPSRLYGTWRVGSTIGHPTLLGAYLVLTIALSLGKFTQLWETSRSRRDWERVPALGGIGALISAQVAALIFTNARGPWLGFVAMAVVFGFILLFRGRRWRHMTLAAVLLVLGVTFQVALSHPASPIRGLSELPYLSRAADVDLNSGSGRQRVLIWGAMMDLLTDSPEKIVADGSGMPRLLIGYGPETLFLTFLKVYPSELRELEPGVEIDRAHNFVLDLIATVGLLGLVVFGTLLAMFSLYTVRLLKRSAKPAESSLSAALAAGIFGYMVSQMVGISDLSDQLAFWTGLALIAALTRGVGTAADPAPITGHAAAPAGHGRRALALPAFALVAFGLFALILGFNATLIYADVQSAKGIELAKQARWPESVAAFERATIAPQLRARSHWLISESHLSQALSEDDPLAQAELFGRARESIETARAAQPRDELYHHAAGIIYSRWALAVDPAIYEDARQAFTAAAAAAPFEVNIYNQWAGLEADLGNYDEALALLLFSSDIDPRWPRTHYQLAGVYGALGRLDESATSYRQTLDLEPEVWPVYLELARLLVSVDKPDEAKPYARRYVGIYPSHWEGRLVLASIYHELDMTDEAQEQAAIALDLAPVASRGQVEELLASLQ